MSALGVGGAGYLLPSDTFLKVSALRVEAAPSHLWWSRRQVPALSPEASLVGIHQSPSLSPARSASCSLEGRDQGHQVQEGWATAVNLNYPSPPCRRHPKPKKAIGTNSGKGILKWKDLPTPKENNVFSALGLGTADTRATENNHPGSPAPSWEWTKNDGCVTKASILLPATTPLPHLDQEKRKHVHEDSA